MKKTLLMFTLLTIVVLATSIQARVSKHSMPGATAVKNDGPPSIVSPQTGDMPIPKWFQNIFVRPFSPVAVVKKHQGFAPGPRFKDLDRH